MLSAYDLRAGIDEGFAEFGVKANIAVSTIRPLPIIVISNPFALIIIRIAE
jgi:hypothetical protein